MHQWFLDSVIRMKTVFGDGSAASSTGGFLDKLAGAGKRLVTGESLFTTATRVRCSADWAGSFPAIAASDRLTRCRKKLPCRDCRLDLSSRDTCRAC